MKKYKLTLLKDLPRFKAGTEVLNISQEQLDGTEDYRYSKYEIYDLRNNKEWVKVEEDTRCDCETKPFIPIRYDEVGLGTCFNVTLSFNNKNIHTWCNYIREAGDSVDLPIRYCPLCGRAL